MSKVRVRLYSHTSTDEDYGHLVDRFEQAGVPRDVADAWLLTNPLYEVAFDFDYEPADQRFEFVGVDL